MTGRTRGAVSITREAADVLVVVPVARHTCHPRVVVTRIADITRVRVSVGWRPASRIMTVITLCRGDEVARSRETGRVGSVMTGITGIGGFRPMDPRSAKERRGSMAVMAVQRCCQVLWIGLCILADCVHTIMTGFTAIHHTAMIKYRADEITCIMTNTTILAGRDVGGCFALSEEAIMTGLAVAGNAGMAEVSR